MGNHMSRRFIGIMKTCTDCGVEKPLSKFNKHPRYKHGVRSICKKCKTRQTLEHRKTPAGRESFLKAKAKYRTSERGKKTSSEYCRSERYKKMKKRHFQTERGKQVHIRQAYEYQKRHPEKHAAKNIINNAIKRGTIIKPTTCSMANSDCKGRIEGHHPDYSKPLEVIWVCLFHHRHIHKQ